MRHLLPILLLGLSLPTPAAEPVPGSYDVVSTARGLSPHRPVFVHPLSFSPDIDGQHLEAVFQISAKQRLLGTSLYFAYTQRSFWQMFDQASSSPFRETNYEPELFYRWSPKRLDFHGLGLDLGINHASNGQRNPLSRSWNRVFATVFAPRGNELYMLKAWWRIPEEPKKSPDDARGDDNPDITDYYGWGEFEYRREFPPGRQMLHTRVRLNPATGKGALMLSWSMPHSKRYMFWNVQLFHGYGDSLIDYDREVTRLGIGLMLVR